MMSQRSSVKCVCERGENFIPREVIEHGLSVRAPAQYCSVQCRRKARFARYVHRKVTALLRSGSHGFGSAQHLAPVFYVWGSGRYFELAEKRLAAPLLAKTRDILWCEAIRIPKTIAVGMRVSST